MQAMILAAGRGQRMQALTDQCPKPLLPVGNSTLLEHHLYRLAKSGITEVVINVAYLSDMIREAIGDGRRYGLHIQWSIEAQALESGGGIKKALKYLDDDFFCVINADILIDWDYRSFISQSIEPGCLGHLFLVKNPPHNPEGDFSIRNGFLANRTATDRNHTFSGCSLLHPNLFQSESRAHFKLADLFQTQLVQQRLSVSLLEAEWLDVGTPERLAEAQVMIQRIS